MIRFLKEIYLTAFTLLFRIPGGNTSGKIWGAIGIIQVIEGITLVNIVFWIEILTGTRFLIFSKLACVILALALYYPNNHVLVTRGHGIKFEREFDNLKKSRKILLVMGCAVVLLAIIMFSVYSFHAYRNFIQALKIQGQ